MINRDPLITYAVLERLHSYDPKTILKVTEISDMPERTTLCLWLDYPTEKEVARVHAAIESAGFTLLRSEHRKGRTGAYGDGQLFEIQLSDQPHIEWSAT